MDRRQPLPPGSIDHVNLLAEATNERSWPRPIGIDPESQEPWLAPTKEEWRLRVVSEAAVSRRTPAGHLRPLLLFGRGDFGDVVVGSSARRGWFERFLHGQLLCLDDRRGGRRSKHLGCSCGWRSRLCFAGWRFEIHTPGEEQRGQQRAHTEKILEDRHWLIRSLANAIGICINAVDWQAVQSERIIAPYRMQRPLTRRKPAAQACRTAVLRLHTPLTRCIPGPQASRTGVTMSSNCWMGATGTAWVDEASPKRKIIGTSFLMLSLPKQTS
jgi:hypothetical protein